MKKTLTIITLFFLVSSGFSQLTWYTQESGVTSPLTDICFINQDTGWISGWTGTMLHTTDGGATWSLQEIPPTNAYWSVFFTDAQNGWASGYAGRIVHTSDGGETWTIQTTPTSYDLYSIYFIDSQNGWAAGGNYGGFPSGIDNRIILHTVNGGVSWATQYGAAYEAPLKSIVFTDENHGYATGDGGIVMVTTDGGVGWSELEINTSFEFANVFFVDSNTGWVCGDYLGLPHYGALFKTTDAGSTWTEQPLGNDEFIADVFFTDEMHGWAPGNSYGNDPIMYYTSDGGDNWEYQALPPDIHGLSCVFFADPAAGWAVGNIGTIISTVGGTVGLEEDPGSFILKSDVLTLEQNYPNPFTSYTRIDYLVPGTTNASLRIYSITGSLIATLLDGTVQSGLQSVYWDGMSSSGNRVSPGMYIIRLQAGDQLLTKRMSLVR